MQQHYGGMQGQPKPGAPVPIHPQQYQQRPPQHQLQPPQQQYQKQCPLPNGGDLQTPLQQFRPPRFKHATQTAQHQYNGLPPQQQRGHQQKQSHPRGVRAHEVCRLSVRNPTRGLVCGCQFEKPTGPVSTRCACFGSERRCPRGPTTSFSTPTTSS